MPLYNYSFAYKTSMVYSMEAPLSTHVHSWPQTYSSQKIEQKSVEYSIFFFLLPVSYILYETK